MVDIPFVVALGLGKSGQAVASFCHNKKIPVVIVDDKLEVAKAWVTEQNLLCEVLDGRGDLSFFDTLVPKTAWCVTSPGIMLDHPLLHRCRSRGMEIVSEVEFALRVVRDDPPKMIAVTGTNGKTTVVELLCHIFKHAGTSCEAIGNIGRPMVEAFNRPREVWPEWFIVELSSFQLETTYLPLFTAGCWLNLSPNHLDRHKSMDEYRQAKQRLSQLVIKDGVFLLHENIPPIDVATESRVLRYGKTQGEFTTDGSHLIFHGKAVGNIPELLLRGSSHDLENYLAAACLALFAGIPCSITAESYQAFSKPHHRIEFIGEYEGVKYFDDSKGTNIAATAAAVDSVPGPVILIAGGVHKGASYAYWKQAFQGKVHAIIAIGQARHMIASDVGDQIPVQFADTLQEAVDKATVLARPQASVVLSPGCSSYDMFQDYKDRGKQFQYAVKRAVCKTNVCSIPQADCGCKMG
jgi:UDP-N-acetylmuramoylalanine--D-glutamate ligase